MLAISVGGQPRTGVQVKYVVLWRALTCPRLRRAASSQVSKGAHKKSLLSAPHCQGPRTNADYEASEGYLTFERFSPASLDPSSHEWHCLFLARSLARGMDGIIMHLDLAIASSLSLSPLSLHETFAINT